MTKTEFIDRLKTMSTEYITDDMYADIEFVYTWHPCIDEVRGKDQIAKLFDMFGYRIIKDMLPTAQKAKELSEEITKKENELQELRWEFNKLRR
jgi:hypothetical protein